MTLRRRVLAVAGAAALLVRPALLLARESSGEVEDFTWHDPTRRRDLPLKLRWPRQPAPAAGWPLVLFSHGLGGSREGGAAWGEAWADAGLAVLHLQHPGSDTPAVREAFRGGRGGLARVANAEQLQQRVADARFALDEIARAQATRPGRWRELRPAAVGMSGHSFGAHTTLALAGQRYAVATAWQDDRIAAFAAFSPSPPLHGDPRAAFAAITRPMLCLTGTQDEDVVGNGATPERRAAVYDALPPGRKAMLLLADADHMTFGGQRRLPALRPRDPRALASVDAHQRAIAAVTTDWWLAHLAGDAAAAERLRRPAGLGPGDRWLRG